MWCACVLLPLAPEAEAASQVRFIEARIVSSIDSSATVADDTPKYPVPKQNVTLYLVLKAVIDGHEMYYTDAPAVKLGGKDIQGDSISGWPEGHHGPLEIKWYKVEPMDKYLSNTEGGWHWEHVRHAETLFEEGDWSVKADVNPTILRTRTGMGTMRFKASVSLGDMTVSSPGAGAYSRSGIKDSVHRISVRGNTGVALIDWAYSFMNLPYIWGSETPTGRQSDHQSERFIGADCADFIVAAARRAGYKMRYGGSHNLSPSDPAGYTVDIAKQPRLGRDGVYRDGDKKIIFGPGGALPGDIVFFKRRHVGILVKDTPPMGFLSPNDSMLHALWKEPREDPISGSYPPPFSIVRLKGSLLKK